MTYLALTRRGTFSRPSWPPTRKRGVSEFPRLYWTRGRGLFRRKGVCRLCDDVALSRASELGGPRDGRVRKSRRGYHAVRDGGRWLAVECARKNAAATRAKREQAHYPGGPW